MFERSTTAGGFFLKESTPTINKRLSSTRTLA
jgi:hypothetical protein